jgi:hypothetical protein
VDYVGAIAPDYGRAPVVTRLGPQNRSRQGRTSSPPVTSIGGVHRRRQYAGARHSTPRRIGHIASSCSHPDSSPSS